MSEMLVKELVVVFLELMFELMSFLWFGWSECEVLLDYWLWFVMNVVGLFIKDEDWEWLVLVVWWIELIVKFLRGEG